MTPYEELSVIISVLGFLAVLITLVFIMRQTRALINQTKLQSQTLAQNTYATIEATTLEIDIQFLSHNELRPYFYSGKDIVENEDNELYRKAVVMCELLIDFFDHILTILEKLPEASSWSRGWWEVWIVDMFTTSPVMRRYFNSVKEWYPPTLTDLWQKAVNQVAIGKTPPLSETKKDQVATA